jgi:hypothetical protein
MRSAWRGSRVPGRLTRRVLPLSRAGRRSKARQRLLPAQKSLTLAFSVAILTACAFGYLDHRLAEPKIARGAIFNDALAALALCAGDELPRTKRLRTRKQLISLGGPLSSFTERPWWLQEPAHGSWDASRQALSIGRYRPAHRHSGRSDGPAAGQNRGTRTRYSRQRLSRRQRRTMPVSQPGHRLEQMLRYRRTSGTHPHRDPRRPATAATSTPSSRVLCSARKRGSSTERGTGRSRSSGDHAVDGELAGRAGEQGAQPGRG